MTHDEMRSLLNALFLLVALIGLITYFTAGHTAGLIIIGIALIIKIIEFIIRFLL